MSAPLVPSLPQLVPIRVLTGAGPYERDAVLSLAFVDPTLGRLCRHASEKYELPAFGPHATIVPEAMCVTLLAPAAPYRCGQILALSFVDPTVARIQVIPSAAIVSEDAETREATNVSTAETVRAQTERAEAVCDPAASTPPETLVAKGVRLRLEWTTARVGRFISLTDKLFAVDRLGWYRHSLAMRLLLPDELVLYESSAVGEASQRLRTLKIAATEALGTPLLAALMPSFSVDAEWLQSIETAALARAAGDLREFIRPFLDDLPLEDLPLESRTNLGSLLAAELAATSQASVEAFLPLLIPAGPSDDAVGVHLAAYRVALIELFGQTAQSSLAVRTTRMTAPNPALDDRLAALAGAVQQAYGQLAVA
jgi:hypothetical protein